MVLKIVRAGEALPSTARGTRGEKRSYGWAENRKKNASRNVDPSFMQKINCFSSSEKLSDNLFILFIYIKYVAGPYTHRIRGGTCAGNEKALLYKRRESDR